MKRLIFFLFVLFLGSCSLLDDFFNNAQLQSIKEEESIMVAHTDRMAKPENNL